MNISQKSNKYIVCPVDGATNIKLEVLESDTLKTVSSISTSTPKIIENGYDYNLTLDEFEWFDSAIKQLPPVIRKNIVIVSSVARGASGAFIDKNNMIIDAQNNRKTIAYTQCYPDEVENEFLKLIENKEFFFKETGSVADFPGGLTLIKRFLYEKITRNKNFDLAKGFATYNILMSGHFLGGDYLSAIKNAGNEHTYWMCHSGARSIQDPGHPSKLAFKIPGFFDKIPISSSAPYKILGKMPKKKISSLGLSTETLVMPGGHDTALSHLPIVSSFYQSFPELKSRSIIHLDSGTWTMSAKIGGNTDISGKAYEQSIMVQGTVDGYPVITGMYGGGNDFQYIKKLVESRGKKFFTKFDISKLILVLNDCNTFILPNISSINRGTGPFPTLKGKIINEEFFYNLPDGSQHIITSISTAFMTLEHINLIDKDNSPIILTAGGAKDPYFGKIIASLTDRDIYIVKDYSGQILSETTTLGAGILGKSGLLNLHPYNIELIKLNLKYERIETFSRPIKEKLSNYCSILEKHINKYLHIKR